MGCRKANSGNKLLICFVANQIAYGIYVVAGVVGDKPLIQQLDNNGVRGNIDSTIMLLPIDSRDSIEVYIVVSGMSSLPVTVRFE